MDLPPSRYSPRTPPETVSVSKLNQMVKNTLEINFDKISVVGEIANYARPLSGHIYFTLKDSTCQLRCVLFRTQQVHDYIHLLKDGLAVELSGQITLYCQNGQYQMIVSSLKLQGDGLLKQQFLALKSRLESQGLFDSSHKKIPPLFPTTIGIISSPSAAGLQDFITTLRKRYPICRVRLFSSPVQGSHAAESLILALQYAQKDPDVDVIVFCRGGGSIEDLWCFNSEPLANAIYQCHKPIISAIGHEKDITICDLTADLRAATPTSAAMQIAPDINDLKEKVDSLKKQIHTLTANLIARKNLALYQLSSKICHPKTLVHKYLFQLQDIKKNLILSATKMQNSAMNEYRSIQSRIAPSLLSSVIQHADLTLHNTQQRLYKIATSTITQKKITINAFQSQLEALNPTNVLKRGYSIIKHNGKILHSSRETQLKDSLSITLHEGKLSALIIDLE